MTTLTYLQGFLLFAVISALHSPHPRRPQRPFPAIERSSQTVVSPDPNLSSILAWWFSPPPLLADGAKGYSCMAVSTSLVSRQHITSRYCSCRAASRDHHRPYHCCISPIGEAAQILRCLCFKLMLR